VLAHIFEIGTFEVENKNYLSNWVGLVWHALELEVVRRRFTKGLFITGTGPPSPLDIDGGHMEIKD